MMSRSLIVGCWWFLAGGMATASTLTQVSVQQQWPWNNKVRIEYTLELASGEAPNDVTVTIKDGAGQDVPVLSNSFSGDLLEVSDGSHVIWWDPAKSGLNAYPGLLRFTLSAEADDQRYCVIDISDNINNQYSVSYLASVPAGGWTEEHKTTKIVFRHIRPGIFTMGTPADEVGRRTVISGNFCPDMAQHKVTLTKDYWIGVFPLTYGQATNVTGNTSYGRTGTYAGNQTAASPAAKISLNSIIGWSTDPSWTANPSPLDGSYLHTINTRIVSGSLPAGARFGVPTEAQWEYACRSGTTTPYHNGTDAITGVGPYVPGHHPMYPVGGYAPNAWGLYDLHGCIWQWTIDAHGTDSYATSMADATDPYATITSWPTLRGGTYSTKTTPDTDTRSGSRYYKTYNVEDSFCGVRLAIVKD